ncbi:MAG: hypothetical protein OXG76_08100 [Acidimicrobiaceae bacterium]|nr:hypothetical protein [Acidimicrobiaceae bacterium]
MGKYQIANVPIPAYAVLYVAVFALMSPWDVAVRLLSAAAITVAVGVAARLLQAGWLLRRRHAPTLADASVGADRRAMAAGQSPRAAAAERVSAV